MDRFLELYGRYYKDMYRLAYYYLGNPQDAEDAVSEAVLKAYEKFDTLRKEESFRSWVFTILVNQCKTQLKKHSSNVAELKEEPFYTPSLEERVLTEDMLSSLNGEERRIVVLAVFGGYKGKEIAEILGYNHSTIRTKYRRALKKLEHKLLTEEVHG